MHYLRLVSTLVFLFVFSFSFNKLDAQQKQTYAVFGQLKDTADKRSLENASVVLLTGKDSLLYKSTRVDKNQKFGFNGVAAGKYVVLITYPGYASLVDKISVDDADVNLGGLVLNTKVRILQEVVIKGKVAAVRMKGDTTEYTADSFHVAPNADVQELLRSMPGFQVNSKGEIVTQGEKVNKILVDGEEFFSDDPAVVTKNLRADAIDKVQVFDKKSDQAVFTGIDDGERTKTINLKLKEEKKHGYFGKAEAGTNFNGLNSDRLMANSFKGKRKLAGYITNDNTTFQGLNWEDSRNYGEGSGNTSMEVTADGGIMISITGEGDGMNVGLPNQQTAGAMFSNKFGKFATNNGGQYQRMQTKFTGNDYNTTLFSTGSQTTSSNKNLTSDRKKYKLNTANEWGTDSTGYFKLVVRGSKSFNDVLTDYNSQTTDDNNQPINSSIRNTKLSADELSFSSSFLFRKKFAKKGRTILFSSDVYSKEINQNLYLAATNNYYRGIIVRNESVDQFKSSSLAEGTNNSTLTYTEPLGKKDFIVFNYGFSSGKNVQGRNTYDKDAQGHYATLVDSLSNRFRFNTLNNNLSVSYRYATKKTNLVVGLGGGRVNYGLTNYETAAKRSVSYNNFIPSATFSYNPKQQRRFRVTYFGKTNNPTLNQIQPIVDNLNPLDVTVGNPNLKQGFTHSVQTNFNDYKVLKDRSFNFWGNFNSSSNAISTSTTIDGDGKRTTSFVNVNGVYGWNFNASYGRKVFKAFNVDLGIRPGVNRNVNFINGTKNVSDYKYTTLSINLSKWGEKSFTFYFGGNASYNRSISTINPLTRAYWSYFGWGNFTYKMKKQKIYFNCNTDITAYQKSPLFPNRKNILLFHPAVRKTFGKGDVWEAKAMVYDLFNKNQNISREFLGNVISESSHNGIRRYAMFTLTYNFSKNGKPQSFGF